MSTTYHISFSVRGGLSWSDAEWRENISIFSDDTGKPMTIAQAKDALMDELAQGREVIPTGQCDNFDYKVGCQGHPSSAQESVDMRVNSMLGSMSL